MWIAVGATDGRFKQSARPRRGRTEMVKVATPRHASQRYVKERRPQWLAGCQWWPTAKSPLRRHENGMRDWKSVILRANRNLEGAKILFFAKSCFRMIFVASKRRATCASTPL